MRFLVDAQLPPALAAWIRQRGHEAQAVRELGLRDAEDEEIWTRAIELDAIIVTKDADFVLIAATVPGTQVLWIRMGNTSNAHLLNRFELHWDGLLDHLASGSRVIELY
jgi:predicted nuclease of predicted toxin-antitoxin system